MPPRRRQTMDYRTGYRHAEIAAWRRFGHNHYRWIIAWPVIRRLAAPALSILAFAVAWFVVPHRTLGWLAAGLAGAAIVTYGAYVSSRSGVQKRLMARAQGRESHAGFGWAVASFVLLMAAGAYLAIGSPWA